MKQLRHFIRKEKGIQSDKWGLNFTPNTRKDIYITAAQKFGTQNLKRLKKISSGRDRDVYALEPGKVLKIAKNPGGTAQNIWEQELDRLGQLKHYETGKDYVVMERVQPPGQATTNFLRPIKKAIRDTPVSERDINNPKIQMAFENAGMSAFQNYPDLALGDFTRKANWGEKDGQPVLIDAGTLSAPSLKKYRIKHFEQKDPNDAWQLNDWREIQQERNIYKNKGKQYKDISRDQDE